MGSAADREPEGVEFLDVGVPSRSRGEHHALHRRWVLLASTAIVAAAVLTAVSHRGGLPSASHSSRNPVVGRSPSPPGASAAIASVPSARTDSPVLETVVGHPLLGVTRDWELFGRGEGVEVRIQLSAGRTTLTAVPSVSGGGPVSFVIGSHAALVRPSSGAPSYLVPDGGRAHVVALPDDVGPTLPGPDPDHIWVPSFGQFHQRMILVDLAGRGTGTSIPVPAGSSLLQAQSDAAGYVMFAGLSGTYEARPRELARITTGEVLAVGPTRWMVSECDHHDRCTTIVIDRGDGTRRVLDRIASDTQAEPVGVISPDGSTAALINMSSEIQDVHLRDLASGADRRVPVHTDLSTAPNTGSMVWSPDSRWLFIAAAQGRLAVVDARTLQVRSLGIPLPKLSQLAVRDVSAS